MGRIAKLARDMKEMKREVRQMRIELERYNKIDQLIDEMRRSAREMLRMSREL